MSVILAERGLDLADIINQYKQDAEIIDGILGKDFKLFIAEQQGNNNGNNSTNTNNGGNGSDTNANNTNTTNNN